MSYALTWMGESLRQKIRDVVRLVPAGRVTTYGAVARRVGACTPRQVGYAMAALPRDSGVPWHRVINAKGEISIGGETGARQRTLLEAEGVVFDTHGHIDLDCFGWGSR